MTELTALLSVSNLSVTFKTNEGMLHAVRGVDFSVSAHEVLAIVGESGSGKSVTSLTIMDLLPKFSSTVEGSIRWGETELVGADPEYTRSLRGAEIAMIFQDPLSALNPVHRIGDQIAEAITAHQNLPKGQVKERVIELMTKVGISAPEKNVRRYPHEFSGGMRQRVMIAIALACNPKLIIADEPTTALDVTVQAQILNLLTDLVAEIGSSVILITHDLGVVAGIADRVLVMYAGRIVEDATVDELFRSPSHPYTRGLLNSLPDLDGTLHRLKPIGGQPPNLTQEPDGCAFAPRCEMRQQRCFENSPELLEHVSGHKTACHFWEKKE